jgi:hypothetical protein
MQLNFPFEEEEEGIFNMGFWIVGLQLIIESDLCVL